jgi:BCD family chlorophyll transporter-like MFS transporter
MNPIGRKLLQTWSGFGPRFLPFADAATPEMPLSRLLRLSLFQVSVGMALVLLVGTLNRVMIVELGVPSSLVAIMISLPVVFAPLRALIGFKSDNHQSALGWRRVPYIWKGTLIQFGGLAVMPFALLVLSGGGNAHQWPVWLGHLGAGMAFLLVGAGIHVTQTAGLALATDLTTEAAQPKVVGLMYVSQLLGMVVSALVFGALLEEFSPARLIQVIQGSAVVTIAINILALWQQESRTRKSAGLTASVKKEASFSAAWNRFKTGDRALRRLAGVGLGTMAFGMQDVLLEPYGGQILNLTVAATTKLTATMAIGGLLGFGLASRVLSRGADPFRMASIGAAIGIPAFIAVVFSAGLQAPLLFAAGVWGIGFGGGLFAHGTLTATMQLAPKDQVGLAMGAWGAVQATGAGTAVAIGGVLRDVVAALGSRDLLPHALSSAASSYQFVYSIEVMLLLATLVVMAPLIRQSVAMAPLEAR